MKQSSVTILGAGAMGMALGVVLSANNYRVIYWDIEKRVIDGINNDHKNPRSLPDLKMDKTIRAEADLQRAVANADMVVFSVASPATREVALSVRDALSRSCVIVTVSKGLESASLKTMAEVLQDALGPSFHNQLAALSGPTLAPEFAHKMPTAAVIASERSNAYSKRALMAFSTDWFHVSETRDVIGVELSGVAKHALAIIAGICDGLGSGSNARAWLMVEGFREVSRLIWKLGGQQETVYGLAGFGDMLATSFSAHSRNRKFGELLGKGKTVTKATAEIGETVEGAYAVESLYKLAVREKLDLPVLTALNAAVSEKKHTPKVFAELLKILQ